MSPPLPTPTYGRPGIGAYTVTYATRINASPETCLQVCRNTAAYCDWNRYAPWVTITKQPSDNSSPAGAAVLKQGTKFICHIDTTVQGPGSELFWSQPAKQLTVTNELVITRLGPVDEAAEQDKEVNAVARSIFVEQGMADEGQTKARLRVAWALSGEGRMAWPSWVLRTERVQEFHLVELEDGRIATNYVCWETYGGLLAPLFRLVIVKRGIRVQAGYLKQAAEKIEGYKRKRVGTVKPLQDLLLGLGLVVITLLLWLVLILLLWMSPEDLYQW